MPTKKAFCFLLGKAQHGNIPSEANIVSCEAMLPSKKHAKVVVKKMVVGRVTHAKMAKRNN